MAKAIDLTGKKVGKLTILSKVPVNERPTQTHGNYWLCKCSCGNYAKIPTAYLTGNGNFTQASCGCDRKIKAFQVSACVNLSTEYLEQFNNDFERFLLIHRSLRITKQDIAYFNNNIEEYKEIIEYFWNDEQFNTLYNFWLKHKKEHNTFYDWAKPSLDHIIPISKGGTNKLENLQFLTVFENLSKRDLTMEEWNQFKKETNTKSDYFIENIMEGREGFA